MKKYYVLLGFLFVLAVVVVAILIAKSVESDRIYAEDALENTKESLLNE